jgi:hypothetical protein
MYPVQGQVQVLHTSNRHRDRYTGTDTPAPVPPVPVRRCRSGSGGRGVATTSWLMGNVGMVLLMVDYSASRAMWTVGWVRAVANISSQVESVCVRPYAYGTRTTRRVAEYYSA